MHQGTYAAGKPSIVKLAKNARVSTLTRRSSDSEGFTGILAGSTSSPRQTDIVHHFDSCALDILAVSECSLERHHLLTVDT